ncbi:MAG: hypothetical protein R2838_21165 [Caldilineaceae bacterium]
MPAPLVARKPGSRPVKIDLPLPLDHRADQVAAGDAAWAEQRAIQAFVDTVKRRGRYERAGKLAAIGSNPLAGHERRGNWAPCRRPFLRGPKAATSRPSPRRASARGRARSAEAAAPLSEHMCPPVTIF